MIGAIVCMAAAIQSPIDIDAQTVSFTGGALQLSGGVCVEHMGHRITCRSVDVDQTAGRPTIAHLTGDVCLDMDDGRTLQCERADVDVRSGECVMTGSAGVVYTHPPQDGDALTLRARRMRIQFADQGQDLKSRIENIVADRHVTVEWGDQYSAHSDQLTYHTSSTGNALVSLQPRGMGGICEVRGSKGEVIRASQIYLDEGRHQILFDSPVGSLLMASQKDPVPLNFSAQALSWDQLGHVLTLSNDVKLEQANFGTITSTDRIQFWQNSEANTPYHIEGITSHGKTVLAYQDMDSELHYLVCEGEASVDPLSQIILFQGGRNALGEIEEQVLFHDQTGELFADSVELQYHEIDGRQCAKALTIDGAVKIVNRAQWGAGDDGTVLQYALADRLLYDPQEEVMRLLAETEQGRVLFYDRVNRVQISAPAVNIRRNRHTGKPSYEGVGDVRFTFADQELAQLRQNFAQELEEKL